MKKRKTLPDREDIIRMARLFRLLGDATRLGLLLQCLDAPRAVSDLAETAGLSLPLTSHHLRLLRTAGLVDSDREGRRVLYRPSDEHVRHMLADITHHVAECLSLTARNTTRRRTT